MRPCTECEIQGVRAKQHHNLASHGNLERPARSSNPRSSELEPGWFACDKASSGEQRERVPHPSHAKPRRKKFNKCDRAASAKDWRLNHCWRDFVFSSCATGWEARAAVLIETPILNDLFDNHSHLQTFRNICRKAKHLPCRQNRCASFCNTLKLSAVSLPHNNPHPRQPPFTATRANRIRKLSTSRWRVSDPNGLPECLEIAQPFWQTRDFETGSLPIRRITDTEAFNHLPNRQQRDISLTTLFP